MKILNFLADAFSITVNAVMLGAIIFAIGSLSVGYFGGVIGGLLVAGLCKMLTEEY